MESEEWKEIPGFDGKYQISNQGQVKTTDRYVTTSDGSRTFKKGKTLVWSYVGLPSVDLSMDGYGRRYHISRYVQELVAEMFVDNPNSYEYVRHIDGDIYNNSHTNLEWCKDKEESSNKVFYSKTGRGCAIRILDTYYNKKYNSIKECSEKTGYGRRIIHTLIHSGRFKVID